MEYIKPATIEEAVDAGMRDGAVFLAGGTGACSDETWIAVARTVDTLVSLENLKLDYIEKTENRWSIGSTVRFRQLLETEGLPRGIAEAAAYTASSTLRNMKTLGGEIASRRPGSSLSAVLASLEAEVVFANGETAAVLDYFADPGKSELIREVRFDSVQMNCRVRAGSRTSHSRKYLVAAVCKRGGDDPRMIVDDCVTGPVRLAAIEEFDPAGDFHASAEYKRYLAAVYIADLLRDGSEEGAAE